MSGKVPEILLDIHQALLGNTDTFNEVFLLCWDLS